MLPGSLPPHKSFSPLITTVMKLCFPFFSLYLMYCPSGPGSVCCCAVSASNDFQRPNFCCHTWVNVILWATLSFSPLHKKKPLKTTQFVLNKLCTLMQNLKHLLLPPLGRGRYLTYFMTVEGGRRAHAVKRWIIDNKAHQRQPHNLQTMTGLWHHLHSSNSY